MNRIIWFRSAALAFVAALWIAGGWMAPRPLHAGAPDHAMSTAARKAVEQALREQLDQWKAQQEEARERVRESKAAYGQAAAESPAWPADKTGADANKAIGRQEAAERLVLEIMDHLNRLGPVAGEVPDLVDPTETSLEAWGFEIQVLSGFVQSWQDYRAREWQEARNHKSAYNHAVQDGLWPVDRSAAEANRSLGRVGLADDFLAVITRRIAELNVRIAQARDSLRVEGPVDSPPHSPPPEPPAAAPVAAPQDEPVLTGWVLTTTTTQMTSQPEGCSIQIQEDGNSAVSRDYMKRPDDSANEGRHAHSWTQPPKNVQPGETIRFAVEVKNVSHSPKFVGTAGTGVGFNRSGIGSATLHIHTDHPENSTSRDRKEVDIRFPGPARPGAEAVLNIDVTQGRGRGHVFYVYTYR